MNRIPIILAAVVVLIAVGLGVRHWLFFRDCLSVEDARNHVGEEATVCYVVQNVSSTTEGSVLNSDRPSTMLSVPSLDVSSGFSTLIPASVRSHFDGDPAGLFIGQRIKVRGRIESLNNALRIIVSDPSQLAS
jgi:hypothetical protein